MRTKNLILWGALALTAGAAVPAGAVPVTVEWDAVTQNADSTPISDLAGYWVYYSTQSFNRGGWVTPAQARSSGNVVRMGAASGQLLSTLNLSGGSTYYFRLTAYDTSLNESSFNLSSAGGLDEEVAAFLAGPTVLTFGGTPPGLRNAFVFPNPAPRGQDPVVRADMGDVDFAEITIFDAAGHAVHTAHVAQSSTVNGRTVFDYRWTGDKPTGVYYAVIHGKKGSETIRARASFAVVR